MAANQIWKPGDRIGEHEILHLLAEGGHGQIYVARHGDGTLRAIKTLHEKFLDVPELRRRFDDEVLLLSAIESVHVVRVYEYGLWEGHPWFSMEYLDGVPLRRVMLEAGGRLGIERAFRLARQMARGVHAAHQLKAVHRDLKPDNILIMPGDISKIVDFGIAKIRGWAAQTTAPGGGFCTPLYAAPEQIDGSGRRADERTDVYSLGVTLWEMLAGKNPFVDEDGQPPSMEVVLSLKLTQPVRRLDLVIDDFPDYLADVVEQATALDPAARYPDAYALAEAIKPGLKRWIRESRPEALPPQPEDMRRLVDAARTDGPPRAPASAIEGASVTPGVSSGWAQTVPMAQARGPSGPRSRLTQPFASAPPAARADAHASPGGASVSPRGLVAEPGTAVQAAASPRATPATRPRDKERRVFVTGAVLGVLVSGAVMLSVLLLQPAGGSGAPSGSDPPNKKGAAPRGSAAPSTAASPATEPTAAPPATEPTAAPPATEPTAAPPATEPTAAPPAEPEAPVPPGTGTSFPPAPVPSNSAVLSPPPRASSPSGAAPPPKPRKPAPPRPTMLF